jgi:hypothetical protein
MSRIKCMNTHRRNKIGRVHDIFIGFIVLFQTFVFVWKFPHKKIKLQVEKANFSFNTIIIMQVTKCYIILKKVSTDYKILANLKDPPIMILVISN